MMTAYKVGERYEEFIRPEGTVFDITDGGGLVVISFPNPSQKERNEFKDGKAKIKVVRIDGITFILLKIGALNWVDAPFNIHLSQVNTLDYPADGQGYGINVISVDGATGEVLGLKLASMTTRASKKLHEFIIDDTSTPFDEDDYTARLFGVFNRYSTDDLVKFGF